MSSPIDEFQRFIEVDFPFEEVSNEAAREKNIRHGHISTLHIWWARRPLASSRATAYAALIPVPKDKSEWENKREFIINLSKWENALDTSIIEQARKDISNAFGGRVPKTLDPFAGGGSIPLEALRLGCETHACDYNPVAVLIEKCTLEYPQKYGQKLLDDVKKWAEWALEQAKTELAEFYLERVEESDEYFGKKEIRFVPVGYIWARTIPCQNPVCGAEIPLIRQYWLCKKDRKKVALYPYIENGHVQFRIVGTGYNEMPADFDPKKGTVSRAIAVCPVCGCVTDAPAVRNLFQTGVSGQRMIAVVEVIPGVAGKRYRIATDRDLEVYRAAERRLEKKQDELRKKWLIEPVPDEEINYLKDRTDELYSTRCLKYGIKKWGDLFNSRQKLALITFADKVRDAYKKMIEAGYDEEYARAVVSYLALGVDKIVLYQTTLGYWHNTRELVNPGMGRQALAMTWDYVEGNSIDGNADWKSNINWIKKIINHCLRININSNTFQSSVTSLPYPDNHFDAVFTDPPYYDNINYAELSDFFYVWLKRTVGDLYPDLFATPLVPKSSEIVANPVRHGGNEKATEFFETNLKKSFQEIYRVLKPGGIIIIYYAEKELEGWFPFLRAIEQTNFYITAFYPLKTEMESRMIAKGGNSLTSSLIFVIRKNRERAKITNKAFKKRLRDFSIENIERFWKAGFRATDLYSAIIGSIVTLSSRFEINGEPYLKQARALYLDVLKEWSEKATDPMKTAQLKFEVATPKEKRKLMKMIYEIETGDQDDRSPKDLYQLSLLAL